MVHVFVRVWKRSICSVLGHHHCSRSALLASPSILDSTTDRALHGDPDHLKRSSDWIKDVLSVSDKANTPKLNAELSDHAKNKTLAPLGKCQVVMGGPRLPSAVAAGGELRARCERSERRVSDVWCGLRDSMALRLGTRYEAHGQQPDQCRPRHLEHAVIMATANVPAVVGTRDLRRSVGPLLQGGAWLCGAQVWVG